MKPNIDQSAVSAIAFAALQLGARIGADPLHAPEVEHLITQYRIERKDAA